MATLHVPTDPILHTFKSSDDLIRDLAAFIYKIQGDAINSNKPTRKFTLALSGGSLPKMLKGLLEYVDREGTPPVEWNRWHIYFADERIVRLDHPESNYLLCKNELLDKLPIPPKQIHHVDIDSFVTQLLEKTPLPSGKDRNAHIDELLAGIDEDMMTEIAESYNGELIEGFAHRETARFPVFDLIMLGMGPDGHTASLFPDPDRYVSGEEFVGGSSWVVPIMNAPKPPPNRVTLTLPAINHAANVAFVATGAAKQDILREVFDGPSQGEPLPASRVKPIAPKKAHWFVDEAAAEKVQYKRTPLDLTKL